MNDSKKPIKAKPQTILINNIAKPDYDRKLFPTKTTIPKSIPLMNIEETLQTAEKSLKNEKILEALMQYDQIFNKFKLDLSPVDFDTRFSEIFSKISSSAINFLNNSKKDLCFTLLTRCEKMLFDGIFGDFPHLKSLIFNHFGCYYRRIDKIEIALSYYEKALEIIKGQNRKKNSGLTHMNLSALYSQSDK